MGSAPSSVKQFGYNQYKNTATFTCLALLIKSGNLYTFFTLMPQVCIVKSQQTLQSNNLFIQINLSTPISLHHNHQIPGSNFRNLGKDPDLKPFFCSRKYFVIQGLILEILELLLGVRVCRI